MNLLKLRNELPENIYNLLNGLYAVPGAKDIFKKYGVEVLNKEVEIEMIQKVKTELELFLNESKDIKEFNQIKQYVEMQISSNTAMLATAEGFMKNMIEMNITTANTQLTMAINQFNEPVMKKATELVNTLIISDVTKESFLKGLTEGGVNLVTVLEKIDLLSTENITEVETRYNVAADDSNDKEKIEDETTKKEIINKDENKNKEIDKKNPKSVVTKETTEEIVDGKKVTVEVTKGKVIPGAKITNETPISEENNGIDLLGGLSNNEVKEPNNSSVFDLNLGGSGETGEGKTADNLDELLTGLNIDFGDGLNF